jgi:cytochrome bd ubiquinol oxidase subunit I
MRTSHGVSPRVVAGNAWFTLIGFMGLYTVLAMLWLFLIYREIEEGPGPDDEDSLTEARISIAAD